MKKSGEEVGFGSLNKCTEGKVVPVYAMQTYLKEVWRDLYL